MIHRNKLIIEQGCCCVPMDYEVSGKSKLTQQSFGYAVIYMDKNGNVDFNTSDTTYYGTGSPIKTEDALRFL